MDKHGKRPRWVLLLFLATAAAGPLAAQADLRIRTQDSDLGPVNLEYSLFTTSQQNLSVRIRHQRDATDFFVTADNGQYAGSPLQRQARNGTGDALFYQVADPAGDVLTDSHGLSGSFPFSNPPQNVDRAFLVRLEPGQFPPPGTYTDTFNVLLYQGTSAAGTLRDQALISVTATMPEVIDMQITAPGGGYGGGSADYLIEFDQAFPGATRQADLVVLANTVFGVEIASLNNGVLVLDGGGASIDYQFRFDANVVGLSTAPATVASGIAPTGLEGVSFAMTVEIADYASWPPAGVYSDVLSISIVGQ